MNKTIQPVNSRRKFLKSLGVATFPTGMGALLSPNQLNANRRTLRILRWKNFIPEFENWFNDVFVTQWSRENGINVVVDNVGLGEIDQLALNEAKAQHGHDMVLFLSPQPALEDSAIDHREIFEESERRYGKAHEFIRRSCYNPVTDTFHGFCESYLAVMLTYRQDLWNAIGHQPKTWEQVRKGGRALRLLHNAPVGISLAAEHNGKQSLRALMSCFGASVQNEHGELTLRSPETRDALKFATALFQEAMTPDVLHWTPPSNNQFMLSGSGSLTVDTMSIIRAAQTNQLPVNTHLSLAPLPEGPAGARGPVFGANVYVIWKFAKNIDLAKKFIVDYLANISDGIKASGFQNLPAIPGTVPDFNTMITSDNGPPDRYKLLLNLHNTQTNLGYPGYTNAAIDEVQKIGVIPKMFSNVALGKLSTERALSQANDAIKPIFDKWKRERKI